MGRSCGNAHFFIEKLSLARPKGRNTPINQCKANSNQTHADEMLCSQAFTKE
jgi:hypothetical protein